MRAPPRWAEAVRTGSALRKTAWWLSVVTITATLLVLRRPDALLNPQFYAEDGQTWFQQAYNHGALKSLFNVYAGYLQVLSRLAAAMAVTVPLLRAPLVLNLTALVVEASPALFLSSARMRNLGNLPVRCVLALLYLVVPKAAEVHASITNAPFNLALLGFLVVIAEPPQSQAGRLFDVFVLLLMALSGPTCILLFPVALVVAAKRREVWSWVRLSLLGVGAAVQGLALLLSGQQRTHQHLAASFPGFCRIVAGQVVLPVLQGRNRLDAVTHSYRGMVLLAGIVTMLAIALFVYAFWRGSLALRSFILFASLLLAASLAFPTPNPTNDHWGPMQAPGAAGRYWYIPGLALMSALLWLMGKERPAMLRAIAAALVCCMLVGATRHWQFASLRDLQFASYAQQFKRLPSGSSTEIPINPPGWSVKLIKR